MVSVGDIMNAEHKKCVMKTLSWRIIATCTTMLFAYVITGQLEFMAGLGIVDVSLKTIFYLLHERAWDRNKLSIPNLVTKRLIE